MRLPNIDDIVRIRSDLPEIAVHRGDLGVVRSTWFAPTIAYEVEFYRDDDTRPTTRALLLAEQIELSEDSLELISEDLAAFPVD